MFRPTALSLASGVVLCLVGSFAYQSSKYPSLDYFIFMVKAGKAERAGEYGAAIQLLGRAFSSTDATDSDERATVLIHLGACHIRLRNFSTALQTLLQAKRLASPTMDTAAVAGLSINIAAAYLDMGDAESADQILDSTLEQYSASTSRSGIVQLYINLAQARSYRGLYKEALDLLETAYGLSNELATKSTILRTAAALHLDNGNIELARQSLKSAQAVLDSEDQPNAYNRAALLEILGNIELQDGNLASAIRHASSVLQLTDNAFLRFSALLTRGKALEQSGRLEQAVGDLRTAEHEGRILDLRTVAADGARVAHRAVEHAVAARTLAGALARLALSTGDQALRIEALVTLERSRASALRELQMAATDQSSPEVARRVNAISDLVGQLPRVPSAAQRQNIERMISTEILSLSQWQAEKSTVLAGLPRQILNENIWIDRLQTGLKSVDAAAFSFLITPDDSFLWLITDSEVELMLLPDRDKIVQAVEALQAQTGPNASAEFRVSARRLYDILFGNASSAAGRDRWFISQGDVVADVPWSGLIRSTATGERYLVEDHSITSVPSLGFISRDVRAYGKIRSYAVPFIGVADPIVNPADPRLQTPFERVPTTLFTRLPGGRREIAVSAESFPKVLTLVGSAATRDSLLSLSNSDVGVLHLAVHTLIDPANPSRSSLVLSGAPPEVGPSLLSALDITELRIKANTVVLSGCSSASGKLFLGEGTLGLPRAFFSAGASNVIATHWDIEDDAADLFALFYRFLNQGVVPSDALQGAQRELIQQKHDFTSQPSYWAAFSSMSVAP